MVAEVLDIDADVVALRMIREQSPGVLPTPQRWIGLDPNTYPPFGPSVATTARRVIGPRRQRKKGTPTGLTVAGGFNHDLTPTELTEIMEGVLLALKKKQPHHGGRFQIPNPATAVATGFDIGSDAATEGYLADQLVFSSGWATGANNGLNLVTGTLGNVVQVAGLTVEASPPADAEIRVVGYEFPTADVDVVNNAGELPRLVSIVTDMTTLGLVPGEWIYIGGTATANKFTNAANNGYDSPLSPAMAREGRAGVQLAAFARFLPPLVVRAVEAS